MKKMMITLVAMLTIAASGHAMSYEQARNEALFLTDKMAYELNLTDEQYEAAYEINLDYLMGVTSYDNVFGTYWERRNLDLSYVLLDWQWKAFRAAAYFYRPLYWRDGFWHFGIYARYPHRDYFYFGRPVFYASYRGGHAWHVIGGHGYYYGRRDHIRPVASRPHFGMLDRWNRGDFRNHHHTIGGNHDNHFGGNRNSSTRTTVNGRQDNRGHYNNNVSHGQPNAGTAGNNSSSPRSLGGYRSRQNSVTTNSHPVASAQPSTITSSRPATSPQPSTTTSSRPSHNSSAGSLGGSRSSSVGSGATRSSGATHISGSGAGHSSGGGHSYGGRR